MDTYKFFWLSSNKYIGEARDSAYSVREYHPDAKLFLFTDRLRGIECGVFDEILFLQPEKYKCWYLNSVCYMSNLLFNFFENEKVVYLDTDTHVCGKLDGIFEALNRFDFVGAHAPGRATAKTVREIPDSFPEYNIGVQGILNSKAMQLFFIKWFEQYRDHQDIYGNNDQAPLRETIWNYRGSLQFGTLPTEYNFRFGMGGQVRERVRVLHGRSKNYQRLDNIVNKDVNTIRSWKTGELE